MSQQINLFNPDLLVRKKPFSATMLLVTLAGILLAGAAAYAYVAWKNAELAGQSAEIDKQYAEAQVKLAELTPTQALLDEIRQAEARAAAQQEIINLLKSGTLGNTAGYSDYMRAFARQTVNGLWLTGFNISGAMRLSLSGGMLNPDMLPRYIQRLGKEPVMQGKTFGALEMRLPVKNANAAPGPDNKTNPAPPYIEFLLQSAEAEEAKK
ncbi:MAG: PilN domain-containing protein [Azonexus sp.]|jgi:hypothetical protein|nr:PilN domain-containing protein [Azonexus sp.]